jgi:predicted dehydrogenase/threonine dehydrogenase-like Zn-dependent dehydrogenase
MKQVLIYKGNIIVEEVPMPVIDSGELLVRVKSSCLSIGTEMSGIKSSGTPIWKKVVQNPQIVNKAFDNIRNQGFKQTLNYIEGKRESFIPTGYSLAGEVVEVGKDVKDITIGESVACAGAQYAYHAEFVKVPRNLCVLKPADVTFDEASTVTLGAIAMQGVRRASPTIGEVFVVVGLGFLGQITVQLLKANGCKVIGIDIDNSRIDIAKRMGLDVGINSLEEQNDAKVITKFTSGYGADGVIITAASSSDRIVSNAFNYCRKKGRVVLVGDVGLNLNRDDFYAKEIDFLISSSTGPGRYDNRYEEQGVDYPIAYVRWTENRNMEEFLSLISQKKVCLKDLISTNYEIGNAREAYESLKSESNKPLMVLLNYGSNTYPEYKDNVKNFRVDVCSRKIVNSDKIRMGIIGAGEFALSVHLPNMQILVKEFQIVAVVTRSGHSAKSIAKQFGALYACTDYRKVLEDPEIDAVLISTRHDLHAKIALEAMKAGKHVLLEKPLCLTMMELEEIDLFIKENNENTPILLTGYNRRFSPHAKFIESILAGNSSQNIINYRMNAGYISKDNWVHGKEGGGRNIGEACHIYDLFTFFNNSEIISVQTDSIIPSSDYYQRNDNFITTLRFANGNISSLTYTSLGNSKYPKEMCDIYYDDKVITLNDYKQTTVFGNKGELRTKKQDKGHFEELIQFSLGVRAGTWPIPWWQQYQSAKVAIDIEEQIFNI